MAPCLLSEPAEARDHACRYVARIDDKITVKLGPRYDMGPHMPPKGDGWEMAASGCDFAIWERGSA